MEIRDRIKELRRVRASDLVTNEKNWRKHPQWQKDGMQAVLDQIGYAGALIAYENDDQLVLIDGHLRQEMTPDDEVPVLVLDVSEAEAEILLATYDPLPAMASEDGAALKVLLDGITTGEAALAALMLDIKERWAANDIISVDNSTDAYYLPNQNENINWAVPQDAQGEAYKSFLVHLSVEDHAAVMDAMVRLGDRWGLDSIAQVMVRLVGEVDEQVEA